MNTLPNKISFQVENAQKWKVESKVRDEFEMGMFVSTN